MSDDPVQAFLPTVRVLEPHLPVIEVNAPSADMPAPSEEEARAADGVFAESPQDRVAAVDAITLAAASMLLRDIAIDTMATEEEEEKEDEETEEETTNEK